MGRTTLPGALLCCGTILFPAVLSSSSPPPLLASSIPLLADLVGRVAGDNERVLALFPAGVHPRRADPVPEARRQGEEVLWYARMGAGMEGRADSFMFGPPSVVPMILEFSEGIDLLGVTAGEDAEHKIFSAALGADGSPGGGPVNPYFWLDPTLVRRQVDRLVESLSALHPREREAYLAGGRRLKEELLLLDEEARGLLAGTRGSPFVTFSGAWTYFARRYGLREIHAAAAPPGGGPARQTLRGSAALIRSLGPRVVFTDVTFPRRPAEEAAARAGARLVALEPFGAPGREGYFDMMRRNIRLIAEGLGYQP